VAMHRVPPSRLIPDYQNMTAPALKREQRRHAGMPIRENDGHPMRNTGLKQWGNHEKTTIFRYRDICIAGLTGGTLEQFDIFEAQVLCHAIAVACFLRLKLQGYC